MTRLKKWAQLAYLVFVVPAVWLAAEAIMARKEPGTAQVFASLAIAYLSVILAVVTAFYAWTNWQTLGLLKAEYEVRKSVTLATRLDWLPDESLKVGVMNLSPSGVYIRAVNLSAYVQGEKNVSRLEFPGAKFVLAPYSEREVGSGSVMRDLLASLDLSSPKEVCVWVDLNYIAQGQNGSCLWVTSLTQQLRRGIDGRYVRL